MVDRTIGESSEPNLYSVRQSMFIAMLGLARHVRGAFIRISYSGAGCFAECYMIRVVYFTCNIVSSCLVISSAIEGYDF